MGPGEQAMDSMEVSGRRAAEGGGPYRVFYMIEGQSLEEWPDQGVRPHRVVYQ